jgi:hypothetical protein
LLKSIFHNLQLLYGWHSPRKIIVFESDDWGSIGTPSREVYQHITSKQGDYEYSPYLKYDSLASEKDLAYLFETLTSVKDQCSKNPVFTINCAVANPDFIKIRNNEFSQYYYEPFTQTLSRYPEHSGSFRLWQEGIGKNIFYPQFHCREHLNHSLWMNDLRSGNQILKEGFDNQMILIPSKTHVIQSKFYSSAYYPTTEEENGTIQIAAIDGLNIFKNIFHYSSRSFIATGYIWKKEIEQKLAENNVKFIKGIPIQREPLIGNKQFRKIINYTGKRNNYGQIHLVRNCFFEPSLNPNVDYLSECLRRIEIAFRWHKPAIISTHRLNYIGNIFPENRDKNLKTLYLLLKSIVKKWPDVEFMNSEELGNIISKSQ